MSFSAMTFSACGAESRLGDSPGTVLDPRALSHTFVLRGAREGAARAMAEMTQELYLPQRAS